MQLELLPQMVGHTSTAEDELIDRARKAVAPIDLRFKDPKSGRYLVASAFVFPSPLRLDFQCGFPDETGHAYIGPNEPLIEECFEGDSLSKAWRQKLQEGFEDFRKYWRELE